MPPIPRRAVVVGANRIPFAKVGSAYRHASNADMLTATLDGLAARYGLAGERLDDVAAGAVLKHARDHGLTREATRRTPRVRWRTSPCSSRPCC